MLTAIVRSTSALLFVVAWSTWGLSPWVRDGGLLIWVAVAAWAVLAKRSLVGALGVALLGTATHLLWVATAWGDGLGSGGFIAMVMLICVQSCPAALAVLLTHFSAPKLGWPLAALAAWGLAQFLATRLTWLPALHALLLADDTGIWLSPAALGGPALLTGLVAAWGFLALERPRTAGGLWLAAAGFGVLLPHLQPESTFVRVGVIQPDITALDARTPSHADFIEQRLIRQIEALRDADFVVTPEGAWPRDPGAAPGSRRDVFLTSVAGLRPVLVGATVGKEVPFRNSVLAVENGRVGLVHKSLLVPVWERAFAGWGKERYTPGTGLPVLPIAGSRVGVLICYEDLFPQQIRLAARGDLLVAATNDSWNGPGAGSRAHLGAARLAAVSAGLWVVRPTLNGRSAVFDRWGSTHWEAPWVDLPLSKSTGHQAVVTVGRGPSTRFGLFLERWLALFAALLLIYGLWRPR